jgi:hypothetical protein
MNLQQKQQILNNLMGRANVGLQASGLGITGASNTLPGIVSSATGVGTAQASGVIGAANALTGGLNLAGGGFGSALTNLGLINAFQQGGFNMAQAPILPESVGGGNTLPYPNASPTGGVT